MSEVKLSQSQVDFIKEKARDLKAAVPSAPAPFLPAIDKQTVLIEKSAQGDSEALQELTQQAREVLIRDLVYAEATSDYMTIAELRKKIGQFSKADDELYQQLRTLY